MLEPGLYEQTVSERLAQELDQEKATVDPESKDLDKAEAPGLLAEYIGEIALSSLRSVGGGADERFANQVELTNRIVKAIRSESGSVDAAAEEELCGAEVSKPARQLLAVTAKKSVPSSVKAPAAVRPETSIAHTSLFTGAIYEPHLYEELRREIGSADRIDMLVSFVMWSGLRLLIEDLRRFCDSGRQLRVITTPYMGATDEKAVVELAKLPGAQVKITYDTKSTRLHAKSYVFHRNTGYTTAYVGSSNLSHAALSSGLEWNLKIARKDQPETIDKIEATFESYWNSDEFELYEGDQHERLHKALDQEKRSGEGIGISESVAYQFDVTPYPFQQRILDKLLAERSRGHMRNLVVAATGTGKTVISAFDYRHYCRDKRPSLLFVAHREEILRQAVSCFRGVLRDPNFGDLWVGNYRPERADQLFVSIQTLSHQDLENLFPPEHFDFIVIDEVHHASAKSYERVLAYFEPKILLGLTATPERTDGADILSWFDHRVAAELRLPEAIDDKLLCPFQYFGVTDVEGADLSKLTWARGGYEKSELENLYVFSRGVAEQRAQLIHDDVEKYVTDLRDVRGLGFCVSREHARFMAEQFNRRGTPSDYLTGDSTDQQRSTVQNRLKGGEIKFIFVVDLYNEGVDIPEVNTLLFLRPTESLTVFLQQLGRGLRLHPGKECCTVLDFIGQANKHYRFDRRFAAITEPRRGKLRDEVENGFVSAPLGCYIQLERKARDYILNNIKKAIGNKSWILECLRNYQHDFVQPLTLKSFVEGYDIDIHDLYNGSKGRSFSRLKVEAGLSPDFHDTDELVLTKAFARLAYADSQRWIRFLLDVLGGKRDMASLAGYSGAEVRMLRMLQVTVWPGSFKAGADVAFASPLECVERIQRNPTMCQELVELLECDLDRIDFVDEPVDLGFDCPLDLHCRYTRDQLLVAMDYLTPDNVREGVKWLQEHKIDVLMNTLNKSDRDYSPTTMYEDYSISPWLFHWQSQNKVSPRSTTGRRYINHVRMGSRVALFVREWKNEATGISGLYTFLGLVTYQSHEGSKPMSIIWRLEKPIPAKFLRFSNKLAS